jgi:hydrogenase-4 component F
MGILAFGLGIGGGATRFVLYHLAANALIKSVLFLASGNIVRAYLERGLPEVTGAIRRLPVSGWMLLLGFVAITGAPPFAPFIGIFGISSSAIQGDHGLAAAAFLVLLGLIFIGMSSTVLPMVQGVPSPKRARTAYRDTVGTTTPLIGALVLALVLGCWLPRPMDRLLTKAADLVEGRP